MSDRPNIEDHMNLLQTTTRHGVLLDEVARILDRLQDTTVGHIASLSAHPVVAARVASIEAIQTKQIERLEAIGHTTEQNCHEIAALARAQEAAVTMQVARLDGKTKLLLGILALAGPLLTAAIAAYAIMHGASPIIAAGTMPQ